MSLNQTGEFIFGWVINVIKDLCCYYEQQAAISETVADVVFMNPQFMPDKPSQSHSWERKVILLIIYHQTYRAVNLELAFYCLFKYV